MTGVEFVDADGRAIAGAEPPGPPEPTERRVRVRVRPRPERRSAPSAVLLVAAAAALVVGSFQTLLHVAIGTAFSPLTYSIDGWGVYSGLSGGVPASHGARLGIALCIAAGVLVAAGVLMAFGRRSANAVTLLGVGLAGGTAAAGVLQAQSVFDGIRAELNLEQLDPSSRSLELVAPTYALGWFVWWSAVAIGCGALALALPPLVRLAGRRRARHVRPDTPPPDSSPGDEVLVTGSPLARRGSDGPQPLS